MTGASSRSLHSSRLVRPSGENGSVRSGLGRLGGEERFARRRLYAPLGLERDGHDGAPRPGTPTPPLSFKRGRPDRRAAKRDQRARRRASVTRLFPKPQTRPPAAVRSVPRPRHTRTAAAVSQSPVRHVPLLRGRTSLSPPRAPERHVAREAPGRTAGADPGRRRPARHPHPRARQPAHAGVPPRRVGSLRSRAVIAASEPRLSDRAQIGAGVCRLVLPATRRVRHRASRRRTRTRANATGELEPATSGVTGEPARGGSAHRDGLEA
jgi:hypothetical protein